MIFPFASSFIAVLVMGQVALAGLTPDQVVTNIGIVATVSTNINVALVPLTTKSSPAQVKNLATTGQTGFQTIITSLGGDVTAMDQTTPYTDAACGPVIDAYLDFIAIHQTLLGTVIGKRSIFAQFFLTAPIAAVLRSLEAQVDAFAISLTALCPSRESTIETKNGELDTTVGNAIASYEALCIPSLLYPVVLPICAEI